MRTRRVYNQWVVDQTLEDYALRYTAASARQRSAWSVANTALGSIAFLACEALGATVALGHGFANTVVALAAAAAIFLLSGIPICYYGARYGVDMDLLTRGAGFGYLGSTITSAVYASFTFILFSIEAAILSGALHIFFGLPLAIGHILSALVVLPIAAYGFRRISRFQNWTQPVWLVLQAAPLLYLASHYGETTGVWADRLATAGSPVNLIGVGAGIAVFLSLLPQIGEQVDYLRFLPDRRRVGAARWWSALLLTGPGWIIPGAVKVLIGALLAGLMLRAGAAPADAVNPTLQYYGVFSSLIASPIAAAVLTVLFVATCQTKINVTNAYAGSIASSNFFSRLTHRHPGRVIWLIFNVMVALMLMEFGIQGVVERVLALYSNFAVAWFGAVTADLIVSKPLGISPPGIEFKRAHLYDVNPVGIGAMILSLLASTLCFAGGAGDVAQIFAPLIGFGVSFVAAPAIAVLTRGRYYIARASDLSAQGVTIGCIICENRFERPDMAHCPVYDGAICSLCCTLEARCHDACKTNAGVIDQAATLIRTVLPTQLAEAVYGRLARFAMLLAAMAAAMGLLLFVIAQQRLGSGDDAAMIGTLRIVFACCLAVGAFAAWYFILAQENRRAAEDETDHQTAMLNEEIAAHRVTDAALQKSKEVADAANLAKSRYIVGVSHEIRTPLNAIAGYAQLLERDPDRYRDDAVRVIRRSSTHLVHLVEGLVDISRIENGSVRLVRESVALRELLVQIADMFRLQAAGKDIAFALDIAERLPAHVFTDGKRLRQILINLVSNAIKYTRAGEVRLTVRWRDPVAEFEVRDSGVGIAPADLNRIFEPFERIGTVGEEPGIGLGLTITRLLADIMGGDIAVDSIVGRGSRFRLKLFFSEAPAIVPVPLDRVRGYAGARRSILAADDDPVHLDMLRHVLGPLGFAIVGVGDGKACLAKAEAHCPDLVILDIAMPGLNGWDTARALRERHGEAIAILMISANAHDFQRSRRQDDPHDDFLVKPYEYDALLERVATLLDLRWLQDETVVT